MNLYTVLVAFLLLAGSTVPAPAEEAEEPQAEMKKVSVSVDEGEGCGQKCIIKVQKGDDEAKLVQVMAGEDEDEPEIIKVQEGEGEPRIIKLKGKDLSTLDFDIDAETRGKVIDQRIKYVRATSQLKADLAVRQLELRKLKLADKPDDNKMTAKRKDISRLEHQLQEKKLDHELAVRKLLPEGASSMVLLDDLGLSGLCPGLPGLGLGLEDLDGEEGVKIKKMVFIGGDEEDAELLFDPD